MLKEPTTPAVVPEPHSKTYVHLISVIAAVGGFLLTYDIVIMSGAIIFLKREFSLTPAQVGFAMTSAIIACFFSPSLVPIKRESDQIGQNILNQRAAPSAS